MIIDAVHLFEEYSLTVGVLHYLTQWTLCIVGGIIPLKTCILLLIVVVVAPISLTATSTS